MVFTNKNDFTVLAEHVLENQQYVKCYDASGNGTLDLYDLALLNSCIQNNANCNFPYNVSNTQASVQFSLADSVYIQNNEKWVQINLQTPNTGVSAFEIGVDNAQILDYQINVSGVDAEIITYPTNNKLSVIYRNTFIPVSNQTYTLMYLKLAAINNSLDICLQADAKAVNNLNQELSPTTIGCVTPEVYTSNQTIINNNFDFNIYNDNEFININLKESKAFSYKIYTLSGQLINSSHNILNGSAQVSMAKMLSGIYIIELKVGEQAQRQKIIIFN